MTAPKVFYAWQNDAPSKHNRYLIRDALQKAIAALKSDLEVQEAPELDHDTKDVPGTPNIAETIAEKIRSCTTFVADLSFVGSTGRAEGEGYPKKLPNPNVLIELGLAAASVGWKRIVLVMNTTFGPPEALPFDLRHRSFPIQYEVSSDEEVAKARSELVKKLAPRLKEVLKLPSKAESEHNVRVSLSFAVVGGRTFDEVQRVVELRVVNGGPRPVEIREAGLLLEPTGRLVMPQPSLGRPLPQYLQDGQSTSVIMPLAGIVSALFNARRANPKTRVRACHALDATGKLYEGPLPDGFEEELMRA